MVSTKLILITRTKLLVYQVTVKRFFLFFDQHLKINSEFSDKPTNVL